MLHDSQREGSSRPHDATTAVAVAVAATREADPDATASAAAATRGEDPDAAARAAAAGEDDPDAAARAAAAGEDEPDAAASASAAVPSRDHLLDDHLRRRLLAMGLPSDQLAPRVRRWGFPQRRRTLHVELALGSDDRRNMRPDHE